MSLETLLLGGAGKSLTSFFMLAYLIVFLPATLVVYGITPAKWKKHILLLASYGFFWLISGSLVVYLLITTLSMHYLGIWLDRIKTAQKSAVKGLTKEEKKEVKQGYTNKCRGVVFLGVVIMIGTLLVLKYSGFFVTNVNSLLKLFGMTTQITIPQYIMPIGISFFSLQALSYIIDVYRGTVKADDNLFRLALFISFFPQIVEGPICRYSQTADQLWNVQQIKYKNLSYGMMRILYGAMKKYIIADRLNLMVKNVFDMKVEQSGTVIAFAAVGYTIQLYMDFSGSMDAVLGTAEIFGVTLPENFARPFFSRSISEFWKRWHISLGAWLRDYVFYPVASSKRMKKITSSARNKLGNHYGPLLAGSVALFCVWFSNGLWHGSAWSYIFFGMYHFALILLGSLTEPLCKKILTKLHINTDKLWYRIFQMLRTSFLVVIGELFFRAKGLKAGFALFKKIITDFKLPDFNGLGEKLNLDVPDLVLIAIALVIILVMSILAERGINVRDKIAKKNTAVRWCVFYALILFILIFGAYGYGYKPVDPIYAKF